MFVKHNFQILNTAQLSISLSSICSLVTTKSSSPHHPQSAPVHRAANMSSHLTVLCLCRLLTVGRYTPIADQGETEIGSENILQKLKFKLMGKYFDKQMLTFLPSHYQKQKFDQAINSAKAKNDLPPPNLTLLSPSMVDPDIAASLARYGKPWRGATRKIRKTGDVNQKKQIRRGRQTFYEKPNLNLENPNNIPIIKQDGPTRNWENQPIRDHQQLLRTQNIWFS